MRYFILAAFVALALVQEGESLQLFGVGVAQAADYCPVRGNPKRLCGPVAKPHVPAYKGTVRRPAKICAYVTHPYWDQLEVKWWGPALADTGNKKRWIKLKPHEAPTKKQCGYPGFRVGTKASCLGGRWIWTPPIYESGTYQMTLYN